jgi:hypothetical protein
MVMCARSLFVTPSIYVVWCHGSAWKTLDTTVMTMRVESMISHGL